jgi:hypothetical protein
MQIDSSDGYPLSIWPAVTRDENSKTDPETQIRCRGRATPPENRPPQQKLELALS